MVPNLVQVTRRLAPDILWARAGLPANHNTLTLWAFKHPSGSFPKIQALIDSGKALNGKKRGLGGARNPMKSREIFWTFRDPVCSQSASSDPRRPLGAGRLRAAIGGPGGPPPLDPGLLPGAQDTEGPGDKVDPSLLWVLVPYVPCCLTVLQVSVVRRRWFGRKTPQQHG